MHKLFARQLAKATKPSGEPDLEALAGLVSAAYEQSDRDQRRTERSMSLMIEELDQLNRSLGKLVEEHTLALRERETELRAQDLRFDAAMNNMSQALLMFDASQRLVICNDQYIKMYGLSPEIVKRGCTLRAARPPQGDRNILRRSRRIHRSSSGTLAQGQAVSRLVELPDGRTIAVLNHPMADGGWVSTHEDITERPRRDQDRAHGAARSLTDLPNRVLFHERLSQALAGIHRGEQLALLYLDLDHFKGVNDTLGHHIGDELLKKVAGRLRGSVRDIDTVARVGGDEFAIIETGVAGPVDVAGLARRICDAIKAPYALHGHAVVLDTSIGIAIAPNDGTEANELLKNADMALYGAKTNGRGSYRFFEPAMDARMKARRALEIALRRALANGEFELHYQPLLRLHDNRVTCCEALLRWCHPERGMIPPSEFIPVAEEIGLIVPLGEWVLRKACADAARWPNDVKVAVNLSPIQVMNQNLVPVVIGALATARLRPTGSK